MFMSSRNKSYKESFGYRASKTTSKKKERSFREKELLSRSIKDLKLASQQQQQQHQQQQQASPTRTNTSSTPTSPNVNSAIVTVSVGPSQRLFAAHEDVLCKSDFFAQACRSQFFEAAGKRIDLPNEQPEVFSAVLEFLYKGDYSPRLAYDKKRGTWHLEHSDAVTLGEDAIRVDSNGTSVLKDTIIYCSAHRYQLPDLQRLALKKQGMQTNVQCSTILSSARYAYSHTPASDAKLRAHYLALIIRTRNTFKRSGTMQLEMQNGGTPLFFDLFVAMVNHLDDVSAAKSPR